MKGLVAFGALVLLYVLGGIIIHLVAAAGMFLISNSLTWARLFNIY